MLLSILDVSLGFRGSVLCFLKSYLSGQSQNVIIKDVLSSEQEKNTGVPQGSVLGPLLLSCYLLPLELIFKQLQIIYQFYADDTVVYFVYGETVTLEKFDLIFSTLQKWFCGAKLKLNTSKTEFIKVVRKKSFNANLKLHMDSKFSNHVKFLGFLFDDKLLFSQLISSVTSACYYVLRKIYSIRDTVDSDVLIELVRNMIISRLDYCNSIHYGLPAILHGKLQRIKNCACRLIFRLSPGTPTSRFIKQLHCLPVQKSGLFKILIFGHRLFHHPQQVPGYLSSLLSRNDKFTRCQNIYSLQILVTKTNFGKRSFIHAIPHEWNRLPFELKLIADERTYRKKQKTFLFWLFYIQAILSI